jgi:Recombination endonuclease VII
MNEKSAKRLAYIHRTPIEIPNRPRPIVCECCGGVSGKTLHLDHCHDTGRFRGWCCGGCNTGIGQADQPHLLQRRLAYLKRPFQKGPIQWTYPSKRTQGLVEIDSVWFRRTGMIIPKRPRSYRVKTQPSA